MIAGDVIEAIPEASLIAVTSLAWPERAVARIDLGAVERNCAHLKSLLAGGASCARS